MTDNAVLITHAEALTRYFSERTKIVMFLLDAAGRIVWANAAFRELAGTAQELMGSDIRELLAPESREAFAAPALGLNDPLHLHFAKKNGTSSHMLTCSVLALGEQVLVVSEQIIATETAVMRHMTLLNNELSNLTRELHRKNVTLEQAMAEIHVLKGLLPICMHCKKIRDKQGYWNQLESYISEHSDTTFSHGICEDCMEKLYPDAYKKMHNHDPEK